MKEIKVFTRQRRETDSIHAPETVGGIAKPKLER